MGRPFVNEEFYAWRWLRRELTRELGVRFRPGGKERKISPSVEIEIVSCVTSAPPGCRGELYERLAERHGVTSKTIQRIALEQLRFAESAA